MGPELIRTKEAKRVTLVGFCVNALLTIFKLVAGITGKSGAMVADAIHSLSDFLTDIVVLISLKLTSKPEDKCHNYGHDKYETVTTAIISVALAIVGYQILKSGIINVLLAIKGELLTKPRLIALVAAAVSIFSNEFLYRYTVITGKKINSSSIIANAWHHRSDAFSSVGTMIGIGGAIVLGQQWVVLDPIASIIVSLFIFKVAYDIFIPSLNELVEKSLTDEEREKIEGVFKSFEGVKGYHKLRMRRIGTKTAIESHILVDSTINIKVAHDISTEIESEIKTLVGENSIVTIHIEPYQ